MLGCRCREAKTHTGDVDGSWTTHESLRLMGREEQDASVTQLGIVTNDHSAIGSREVVDTWSPQMERQRLKDVMIRDEQSLVMDCYQWAEAPETGFDAVHGCKGRACSSKRAERPR